MNDPLEVRLDDALIRLEPSFGGVILRYETLGRAVFAMALDAEQAFDLAVALARQCGI